jgi:hypothetical protein
MQAESPQICEPEERNSAVGVAEAKAPDSDSWKMKVEAEAARVAVLAEKTVAKSAAKAKATAEARQPVPATELQVAEVKVADLSASKRSMQADEDQFLAAHNLSIYGNPFGQMPDISSGLATRLDSDVSSAVELAAERRVGVKPQVPGAEAIITVEVGDTDERFGGCGVCGKELRRFDDTFPDFSTLDEWDCDVCNRDFGASDILFCCDTFHDCDWGACADCFTRAREKGPSPTTHASD